MRPPRQSTGLARSVAEYSAVQILLAALVFSLAVVVAVLVFATPVAFLSGILAAFVAAVIGQGLSTRLRTRPDRSLRLRVPLTALRVEVSWDR